ncbi:helix-turn-helix domain-containing protein [Salinispora fenicalii]|uniref:helix-turn-helix domain-containing protein n=1 Tax=Salinispora fenicalii TaxID=1137263 RepID=UPI00047F9D1F|nr:helix-turn-helix transcriptional regulator [Salinispora fenicalii]
MPAPTRTIVDPRFGAELRQRREARGLTLRQLGVAVSYGKSLLHQLETGRTRPTVDVATRLDDALAAGGALAALVADMPTPSERALYAAQHPRRVDHGAVDALADLLASYRRLEDSIGSTLVVDPVRVQLDTVVSLLRDAGHQVRPAVVDMAAQWAQFAGWLGIATGDDRAATMWLRRALQWATEAGNRDLIAAVLSFQGHQAEGCGDLPSMIGLSGAARRDDAVHTALRAYSAGQGARGLAMADAHPREVIGLLSEAADLAEQATGQPLSPWGYWYTPAFFSVQQGIVWRYLGARDDRANDRALRLLTAGVAGASEDARGSDWHGRHLVHLAVAHTQAGDTSTARQVLDEARAIADATASRALAGQVTEAVRRLSATR